MKFDYCDISNISDNEYMKFYDLMNNKRQDDVKKYYRTNDKKCTIAGEMLVKKIINKFWNIKLEEIKIDTSTNNKPYIVDYDIKFNISHCDNIVVCVVSNKLVGIDIEKIRPVNLSMVKKFCNEKEIKYIFNHIPLPKELVYTNDKNILTRFFEVWTSKEAYIKCENIKLSNIKEVHLENIKSFKLLNDFIVSIYMK